MKKACATLQKFQLYIISCKSRVQRQNDYNFFNQVKKKNLSLNYLPLIDKNSS